MARLHNTNRNGGAWTEQEKLTNWNKGRIIQNQDSRVYRMDKCGQVMQWSQHGNRNADYGWEIDHIYPASAGGSDNDANLQPLNWKNNSAKSDNPNWQCGQ